MFFMSKKDDKASNQARQDDPTQAPEFQRVVRAFLATPPQPHKPKKPRSAASPRDASTKGDEPSA
jgi:hypothetical protein